MPPQSRATLETVAHSLGVSQATVSKVANGKSGVSSSTRARVQVELERHSYLSPSRRRPPERFMVDFVCVDLGPYSIEILRGLIAHAAETRIEVTVSTIDGESLRQRNGTEWADELTATGKSGLILLVEDVTETQIRNLRDRGVPVVVIDPIGPTSGDVVSVSSTNWAGGKIATDHLIDAGHTRIGFIGGNLRAECMQARLSGYRSALTTHEIEVSDNFLFVGSSTVETGVCALERFLNLEAPPTAIVTCSDEAALGVIAAARRHGIAVPDELSVVGFDDTYLAALSVPALTTVAQPLQEIGRIALKTVIRIAQGETLDSSHVELATRLVIRESTSTPANS